MAKKNSVQINFDFQKISAEIESQSKIIVKSQTRDMQNDIEKETEYWKNPIQMSVEQDDDSGTISIDDERYLWIDEGTKRHVIKPKNARILRFRSGDSVRNEIARRRAMSNAADVAQYTTSVNHPGIKPRSITQKILEKRTKKALQALTKMLEKATK